MPVNSFPASALLKMLPAFLIIFFLSEHAIYQKKAVSYKKLRKTMLLSNVPCLCFDPEIL